MINIPFNKPFLAGNEIQYITEAVQSGKISGNGTFTQKCQRFFEERYGFRKCLLTTSCTDALEMSSILLDIKEGDEVIMPSFTFVSTPNAFVLRGAKIIFADSGSLNPNIDAYSIERLITSKTRAIVIVHYAGLACDMDKVMEIALKYNLFVVEDAAQAIDSYYLSNVGSVPLGSIGHLAAFSFHETKNIIAGEGGMLVINDKQFEKRAEIIWEKGTNRSAFWRGEVDKYGWVDIGSSFLPSEIIAAFLYAQLENVDQVQKKRKLIWDAYERGLNNLAELGEIRLPYVPSFSSNNAHMFYLLCKSVEERSALINRLKEAGVLAVFHYLSLHNSSFYMGKHDGRVLNNSDFYSDCLVRLPLYYYLIFPQVEYIVDIIQKFYKK